MPKSPPQKGTREKTVQPNQMSKFNGCDRQKQSGQILKKMFKSLIWSLSELIGRQNGQILKKMFKSLIWSLSESIGRLNANNGLNVDPLLTSKLQGMEGSNLQEVKKNDQFFRGDCIWSFYFKDQNQINSSTPRPLLRANSETALFQVKRNSGNFRYQNEELMH